MYAGLVAKAQAKDQEALNELIDAYRPVVMAYVYSRTGTMQDAEDLTQEILITICQRIRSLKEPSAFPAWLKTITLNACRGWFRRLRPWPETLDATDRPEITSMVEQPLDVLISKESQRVWRNALLKLPDANRTALLMHVWGGCSYEEISVFIEMPVTTVVGRIHRAKEQLRRILKRDSIELTYPGGIEE